MSGRMRNQARVVPRRRSGRRWFGSHPADGEWIAGKGDGSLTGLTLVNPLKATWGVAVSGGHEGGAALLASCAMGRAPAGGRSA
jgi:hypothetical protein